MAARNYYTDIQVNKNQLLGARYENAATFPTGPGVGQVFFNTADNKFYGFNGTAWVDLSQVILSPVTIKGEISNAGTNPAYPASPTIGDTYFVTVQPGTIGGAAVEVGLSCSATSRRLRLPSPVSCAWLPKPKLLRARMPLRLSRQPC
jgi:hypothetical protein